MATLIMKGQNAKLYCGETATEVEIGRVKDVTVKINNNVTSAYKLGSRAPIVSMEGLANYSGTFKNLYIDALQQAKALGYSSKLNFVGINKSGSTHVIEDKVSTTIDADPASWGGAEIESTEYDELEADDANTHDIGPSSGTTEVAQALFKFDNLGTAANIDWFMFRLLGYGDQTAGTDGVTVEIWDDTNSEWDTLGAGTGTAVELLEYLVVGTTTYPIADYMDSNDDIWIQVRTTGTHAGGAVELYIDYAELLVHDTSKKDQKLPPFSIVTTLDDGTTTINATMTNAVFSNWTLATTPGELVVEDVEFHGTGITVA